MKVDTYLLGHRPSEQERLQQQADQIGVAPGARVVEIGCGPRGCLDLLAERVGADGAVVGVEPNGDAVARARRYVHDRGLRFARHLDDTATVVISDLFIQARGRKPNRRETSEERLGDGGHYISGR